MVRQAADHFSGITPGLLPALGASALLHLGVLLGVQPPLVQASAPRVLEVRLQAVSIAVTPSTPAVLPKVHHIVADTLHSRHIITTPSVGHLAIVEPASAMPRIEEAHVESATVAGQPDPATPEPIYYAIEQLDTPPRMLGDVQQLYPARARAAEVEGFVTLSLLISERGEVDEIRVVKAQPQDYFEKAALTMLGNQHFSPAIKQSRAVKSRWLTTVRYRLQG